MTLAASRLGRLRPSGLRPSLFVQVLTLVLVSLVAAQAVNLAIIFSLPPPQPILFRVSEIVTALQGGPVVSAEGVRLTLQVSERPPPAYFVGHQSLDAMGDIQRRMNLGPQDVVVSRERRRGRARQP